MKNYKYFYNIKTGTLHKLDGCYHSKSTNTSDGNTKFYENEDECINKKYFKKYVI